MSNCTVPKWNLRPQSRQEQATMEGGHQERAARSSSQVHYQQQNPNHLVHTSNHEVAELTWENGQLAMHGFGGLQPTTSQPKPIYNQANDTLESIVHQATTTYQNTNPPRHRGQNISSMAASSSNGGGGDNSSARVLADPASYKKRTHADSDQHGINSSSSIQEERREHSVCVSASATFGRDNDRTMMTWTSFDSPRSMKTKTTNEDSTCHNGSENLDEDRETKGETGRSHSMRRSRAAAIHNQSERRRRDRINQKMKALQKLVPNSSKTDKASMLDEVIEYLKQLQAQIQMMNTVRNMPQMMLPIGIQQHQQQQQQQLQMTLLARMAGMSNVGLGMGMSMLDMSTAMARANPVAGAANGFVQPPFVLPTMIPARAAPQQRIETSSNGSGSMHDPYSALLAQQSMNMDMYSKMAALYQQQVNQTTIGTHHQSQSNHDQRN